MDRAQALHLFALYGGLLLVFVFRGSIRAVFRRTRDWVRRETTIFRGEHRDNPFVPDPGPSTQTTNDAIDTMVQAGCTAEEAGRLLRDAEILRGRTVQEQDFSSVERRILGHTAMRRTEPEDIIHALRTGRTIYGENNWRLNITHDQRFDPEEGPAEDTTIGRGTIEDDTVVAKFAMNGPGSTPEDEECDLWVDMRGHRFLKADYDEWETQAAMPNKVGGRVACISDGNEVYAIVHTISLPGLRDVVPELEELKRRDGRLIWNNMSIDCFRWLGKLSYAQRYDLFILLGLPFPEGKLEDRGRARRTKRRNLDLT